MFDVFIEYNEYPYIFVVTGTKLMVQMYCNKVQQAYSTRIYCLLYKYQD